MRKYFLAHTRIYRGSASLKLCDLHFNRKVVQWVYTLRFSIDLYHLLKDTLTKLRASLKAGVYIDLHRSFIFYDPGSGSVGHLVQSVFPPQVIAEL